MLKKILFIFLVCLIPSLASATTYYVSPSGSGSNCTEGDPCALSTANSSASAGDTVILRDGTYGTTQRIEPARSGTSISARITYQNYTAETPILRYSGSYSIYLSSKNWIVIDGIRVYNSSGYVYGFFYLAGSSYNEIKNCSFSTQSGTWSASIVRDSSTHNWIHDNVFEKAGSQTCASLSGTVLRVGANVADGSNYNTIEGNQISYGGHDAMHLTSVRYNVVRGNIYSQNDVYFPVPEPPTGCENVPSSGYFGSRNLLIEKQDTSTTDCADNLVEGNRLGYGRAAATGDQARGIENGGVHTIVRYNYIYDNGSSGYHNKDQNGLDNAGDYARVYNNTLYHNTYGDEIDTDWQYSVIIECYAGDDGDGGPDNVVIKNNIVYDQINEFRTKYGTGSCTNASYVYTNNLNTNPTFTNPTLADKTSTTLPDLSFGSGSSAIDGGTYLTTTNGSGSSSTTLAVYDARYFQDGTWGSSLSTRAADWIAIGTVDNVVQISSINYVTNTITLSAARTWASGASVWLYKKSDGVRVLYGNAPDYGASEYNATDTTDPVMSSASPSVTLACVSNPLSVYLSVQCTDNVACTACKAHATDVDIDSMSISMSQSGNTWTSTAVSLACDTGPHTYYIKCEDAADNETDATTAVFSISAPDVQPPASFVRGLSYGVGTIAGKSGGGVWGESSIVAPTCNSSTDQIGDREKYSTNLDLVSNGIYCILYMADCSGTLGYAYLYHNTTDAETAKICVYSDDGDGIPNVGDLKMDCSGAISSGGATGWKTDSLTIGDAVTNGTNYWVCAIGGADTWNMTYNNTSGTRTSKYDNTRSGTYATPPDNLAADGGGWATGYPRDYSMYVQIE